MDKLTLPSLDSNFMSITKDISAKDDKSAELSGAGEILWKAQEDIRQMKEALLKEAGTDKAASDKLRGIIEKVEDSIKKQTESLVKSVNNQCDVIPESPSLGRNALPKRNMQSMTAGTHGPAMVVRSRSSNKVGPGVLPPGQQFMSLQKLKAIINPLSKDARKLLNEKYSVPLPSTRERNEEEDDEDTSSKPQLQHKSLSANLTRGAIKNINAPPIMTADDANQGIRFLIERQFIPSYAKITLEPPPIHSKQLTLHTYQLETETKKEKANAEDGVDFSKAIELVNARQGESRQSRVTFKEQAISTVPKNEAAVTKCNYQFANKSNNREFSALTDSASTMERALVPCSTPTFDNDTILHKFVIQHGKTRNSSEDFMKFKGRYQTAWGSIVSLLKKMEKFLQDYSVPVAIINGDQFADLALYFDGNSAPTKEDLLTCILNNDDVGRILMIPGRRYIASDGREYAATKIQSAYRRFKDRTDYLFYRKRKWAAGLLALNWVMICKVSLIRKQLRVTREEHLARYKIRFNNLRNSWNKLQSSKRVIIHIPSLGYVQQVRNTLYDLDDRQNRQIGRIFEASDPNVEVIYIWPWNFSADTEKYYMKLLDLTDTKQSDVEPPSKRCTLLSPESSHRFPSHNMCVSTLLKYSPQVLNRLENLIKGKNAYIVPGLMHKDDLHIADYLGVPILGCEPDVAILYSSKSGARRIFEDAKVDKGPSDNDIYTTDQLYESLADLATTHLDIKRWLFKIDDEIDGRGIAYCDLASHLTCYTWAVKEAKRYGEKWNKKWAREKAYMKILAEIPDILEEYAIVSDKKQFTSWKHYLSDYFSKGGIIEACPPADSTTSLSVDVLIEPTGRTKIICAADQMNGRDQYKCLGYTFPQLSVDPEVLQKLIHDICNCCKSRGIVGYMVITFVTFIDPTSLQQRIWPVGLNLSYGVSNSSFQILRHVTRGSFDFDNSLFTTPVLSKRLRPPYRTGRRKKVQVDEEKCSIEQRFAVFSHVLHHESLRSVQSSVLFQLCKSHGIGFDIKAKLGTLFTVIDQLHKETFGILTVGVSMQEALTSFGLNLSLIHRDISLNTKISKTNLQDLLRDIQHILDLSVVNEQPQESTQSTSNADDLPGQPEDNPDYEKQPNANRDVAKLPCPSPVPPSNPTSSL